MTDPTRDDRVAFDARVRGRVQGVGFRYFVLGVGLDLGLDGWVANEADGTVRCVAEGPRAELESLLAELRSGPPGASVVDVDVTWQAPTDGRLGRFRIRSRSHPGD